MALFPRITESSLKNFMRRKKMNAIDFLMKEHHHVRVLLADLLNPSHRFDTRQKLFSELSQDLLRHEEMEHTVWYPQFKNKVPDTGACRERVSDALNHPKLYLIDANSD